MSHRPRHNRVAQEPRPPVDYDLGEMSAADEQAQRAGDYAEQGKHRQAAHEYGIAANLYDAEGSHEAAREMREAEEIEMNYAMGDYR